jgi:hypothetical protein
MFVAISTSLPSLLSIPCFYYAGQKYVEHKIREDKIIEAAETYSFKARLDQTNNKNRSGLKPVSSSVKLTRSQIRKVEDTEPITYNIDENLLNDKEKRKLR